MRRTADHGMVISRPRRRLGAFQADTKEGDGSEVDVDRRARRRRGQEDTVSRSRPVTVLGCLSMHSFKTVNRVAKLR